MRVLLVLFLSLAVFRTAGAAVGQDFDTVDNAYGDVVKRHLNDDGTVIMTYRKDHYLFHVLFKNLQSVSEEYLRTDGKDLSNKEIEFFLKANGRGKWVAEGSDGKKWHRSDGKLVAEILESDNGRGLSIHPKKH
jgi:hypothetical protein